MRDPVIQAAQQAANDGLLLGIMTVFFFGFFAAYAVWAWWPGNREHMEKMASAPLDDDIPSAEGGKTYVLNTGGRR